MARAQVTIGKKIGRGFAVTLILITLLTGVYQFALVATTTNFTDLLKVEMAIAVHTTAALRDLNKCRRYDKDFLLLELVLYLLQINLISYFQAPQKLSHVHASESV